MGTRECLEPYREGSFRWRDFPNYGNSEIEWKRHSIRFASLVASGKLVCRSVQPGWHDSESRFCLPLGGCDIRFCNNLISPECEREQPATGVPGFRSYPNHRFQAFRVVAWVEGRKPRLGRKPEPNSIRGIRITSKDLSTPKSKSPDGMRSPCGRMSDSRSGDSGRRPNADGPTQRHAEGRPAG